jgi:hypothetical protein
MGPPANIQKLYSTKSFVAKQPKKKNITLKKPYYAISMPAQPANPQPTEDVRVPRKRQVPLDANGEPVTGSVPKKQKSASEKTGKKKAAPAKAAPQKKAASKSVPAKAAPAKRKPSVEIEDVADEDDLTYSERPHNPRNILEAADGSDDDNDDHVPPPAAMDVDADADKELEEAEVENVEAPEEDDEAELGPY